MAPLPCLVPSKMDIQKWFAIEKPTAMAHRPPAIPFQSTPLHSHDTWQKPMKSAKHSFRTFANNEVASSSAWILFDFAIHYSVYGPLSFHIVPSVFNLTIFSVWNYRSVLQSHCKLINKPRKSTIKLIRGSHLDEWIVICEVSFTVYSGASCVRFECHLRDLYLSFWRMRGSASRF